MARAERRGREGGCAGAAQGLPGLEVHHWTLRRGRGLRKIVQGGRWAEPGGTGLHYSGPGSLSKVNSRVRTGKRPEASSKDYLEAATPGLHARLHDRREGWGGAPPHGALRIPSRRDSRQLSRPPDSAKEQQPPGRAIFISISSPGRLGVHRPPYGNSGLFLNSPKVHHPVGSLFLGQK